MPSNLSRRRFLVQTLAAGAATSVGATAARVIAAPAKPGPYGALPMGIQSFSLRGFDTLTAIGHVYRLGLRHIEFFEGHFGPAASKEKVEQVAALVRNTGIKISGQFIGGFGNDQQANRKVFAFLKRVGVRNIITGSEPHTLKALDPLVAEFDIRVCIHNHGPDSSYDTLGDIQKALRGRDRRIGACVDTGHALRSGEDPVRWVRELKDRVFALHIKDVAEMKKRTHNVVIGEGHLDVTELFQTLQEMPFPADGSLSMEFEERPENPISDIRQCLDVAKKVIATTPG